MAVTTFYTPEQVAGLLQLSLKTIYGYLRSGELRAAKLGRTWRIGEDDLQGFLTARRNGPAAIAGASATPAVPERSYDPNWLPTLEELTRPDTPEELERLREIWKRVDERAEAMAAQAAAKGIPLTDSADIIRAERDARDRVIARRSGG